MTVIAGYIRMLLKDRAGPLSDQQRRLLEEAEKSCARLSALVAEVSDLASLEAGTAPFSRQAVDIRTILRSAVEQLPPLPDREVQIVLETDQGPATVQADTARLTQALGALIAALRREVVMSDRLLVRERRTSTDRVEYEIRIADQETLEAFDQQPAGELPVFDEWRGGSGLSLAVARRVINAHGGRLLAAPGDRKVGALILLPAA